MGLIPAGKFEALRSSRVFVPSHASSHPHWLINRSVLPAATGDVRFVVDGARPTQSSRTVSFEDLVAAGSSFGGRRRGFCAALVTAAGADGRAWSAACTTVHIASAANPNAAHARATFDNRPLSIDQSFRCRCLRFGPVAGALQHGCSAHPWD